MGSRVNIALSLRLFRTLSRQGDQGPVPLSGDEMRCLDKLDELVFSIDEQVELLRLPVADEIPVEPSMELEQAPEYLPPTAEQPELADEPVEDSSITPEESPEPQAIAEEETIEAPPEPEEAANVVELPVSEPQEQKPIEDLETEQLPEEVVEPIEDDGDDIDAIHVDFMDVVEESPSDEIFEVGPEAISDEESSEVREQPRIDLNQWGRAHDALYEDVLWLFKMGDNEGALNSLGRLIDIGGGTEELARFLKINQSKLNILYHKLIGAPEVTIYRANGSELGRRYFFNRDDIESLMDNLSEAATIEELASMTGFDQLKVYAYLHRLLREHIVRI